MHTTKMTSTDKDFASFNSKNLYDMTIEELEESIQWKKQFLHLLTKRSQVNSIDSRSLRE